MIRVDRVETLPAEELKFLTDMMSSTGFKNWKDEAKEGWDALQTNPNLAFGVRVFKGHLVALQLPACGLSGKVPESVGQCKFLEKLNLNSNRSGEKGAKKDQGLTGSIPASIGQCERLVRLDLSENAMDGSLPAALGELKQLDGLYLSDNRFGGALPAELAGAERLQYLYVGDNALVECVPEAYAAGLRQLKHLVAFGNRLTGDVPPGLASLPKLEVLWLFQGEQETQWTTKTADAHPTCLQGATQELLGEALWY